MSKTLKITLIALGVICIAAVVSLISMSSFVKGAVSDDRIASGVSFEECELGGMTAEEATKALSELEKRPDAKALTVSVKGKEITFEIRNAGFVFNPEKTAEAAYSVGREGSLFKKFREIKALGKADYKGVSPSFDGNEESFSESVITLLAEQGIDFSPFTVTREAEKVKVKLSEDFEEIDFEKLYKDAEKEIYENEPKTLVAVLRKGEKIKAQDIYDSIYVKTEDAKSEIRDGITVLIPETDGVNLDITHIENALSEGKKEFDIPVTAEKAKVTLRSIQGDFFSDVIGSHTTYFNTGVTGRAYNVYLAATKINDVVLNVGDEFSFNQYVGRANAAEGFRTATVYTAEGMVPGVGGGICQVSSTLYNAALYANLEITQRRNHSYTVAYVKNGLDATVSYGSLDFKFKNNTKGPIKISAYTNGGAITVKIYGKKLDSNKVELVSSTIATYPYETVRKGVTDLKPGETRVAQAGSVGVRASVMKIIRDSSGNTVRTESLGTDYYIPMNEIVEVGLKADGTLPEEGEIIPAEGEIVPGEEGNNPSEEAVPGEVTDGTGLTAEEQASVKAEENPIEGTEESIVAEETAE